jgi:hypothetical protein
LGAFFLAFSTAYNVKELVSGYQSIDMPFIVMHVKSDVELSISVLRNEKLFTKQFGVQNRSVFKKPKF